MAIEKQLLIQLSNTGEPSVLKEGQRKRRASSTIELAAIMGIWFLDAAVWHAATKIQLRMRVLAQEELDIHTLPLDAPMKVSRTLIDRGPVYLTPKCNNIWSLHHILE